MNRNLSEKTKQWMELERKTLEQRKLADQFYEDELMTLIEEEFVRKNKDKVTEKVEYLVVSVGTSYEPIVLNIRLLEPERILFLYTEKSEETLNKVVSYCCLDARRYDKEKVNEIEPQDVYREVKKIYLKWEKPRRLYIDITGGTKAISAACALAGALIDIQMVYVSSTDYLVDFRKPAPGSERLNYIENPISVFGDMEIEKGIALFGKYNFAGAREKFAHLKEVIPDPRLRQQLDFVYLLAEGYEYWDALDFPRAYESISKLGSELRRDGKYNPDFLLVDFARIIDAQEQMLLVLKEIPVLLKEKKNVNVLKDKEIMHTLMLTMYQNGLTRMRQEKYDMATLLFYRLLEMIAQRRLIRYGIYVAAPDYAHIVFPVKRFPELSGRNYDEKLAWLKDGVYAYRSAMFKNVDRYLPNQIALLDGFVILAALGDPVITEQKGEPIEVLKLLRNMVFLRNNSIFAHGLGPVGSERFKKFFDYVEKVFRVFCRIERIDFKKKSEEVEWVMPQKSKNYMRVWE